MSGSDVDKLLLSPQIEGFLSKGIDVLLFTDPVDSFWVNNYIRYKDYEIKSTTRINIDLELEQDTAKEISDESKNTNEESSNTDSDRDKDTDKESNNVTKDATGSSSNNADND